MIDHRARPASGAPFPGLILVTIIPVPPIQFPAARRPAMSRRFLPVLFVLAACAKPADAPPEPTPPPPGPQVVTFVATDFVFTGPDTIAPGATTIKLVNTGLQEHHLILGQLDSGKTMQDVLDLMAKEPNAEPAWLVWRGGASAIAAGDSTSGTSDLPAGRYLAFCFLPDPSDKKPHLMKGMIKEIIVTGTPHDGVMPEADGEIRMSEFGFAPTVLTAGPHVLRVINDGKQPHEVVLVRLADGATAESYVAALTAGKGPPPGVPLGGSGALSAGLSNLWSVTLAAGNYLLVCFIPDPADGVPHFVKGMVQTLTVN